jgi:hypothetical protein
MRRSYRFDSPEELPSPAAKKHILTAGVSTQPAELFVRKASVGHMTQRLRKQPGGHRSGPSCAPPSKPIYSSPTARTRHLRSLSAPSIHQHSSYASTRDQWLSACGRLDEFGASLSPSSTLGQLDKKLGASLCEAEQLRAELQASAEAGMAEARTRLLATAGALPEPPTKPAVDEFVAALAPAHALMRTLTSSRPATAPDAALLGEGAATDAQQPATSPATSSAARRPTRPFTRDATRRAPRWSSEQPLSCCAGSRSAAHAASPAASPSPPSPPSPLTPERPFTAPAAPVAAGPAGARTHAAAPRYGAELHGPHALHGPLSGGSFLQAAALTADGFAFHPSPLINRILVERATAGQGHLAFERRTAAAKRPPRMAAQDVARAEAGMRGGGRPLATFFRERYP